MTDIFDAADQSERENEQNWAEVGQEHRQKTLDALYDAAMYGLSEESLRWLCFAAGVDYKDLEKHKPHANFKVTTPPPYDEPQFPF